MDTPEEPKPSGNGSTMVSVLILLLFLAAIVGVIVLKWHAPDTDSTFLGVIPKKRRKKPLTS